MRNLLDVKKPASLAGLMREVVRYAGMGRPVIHVTLIKGNAKRYSKKDCLADIRSRRKKILLLRLSEAPGKMGQFF